MSAKWVRTNEIVWEDLDREALLVDPESQRSWRLNATAAFIWKHCNGATGPAELARTFAKESGEKLQKMEREIAAFCQALQRAGLARLSAAASAEKVAVAGFSGLYSLPAMTALGLTGAPRRRPSPRGNSGPG